ncbi:uncharacterized protein LOC126784556 [Argentina anserina]|uniref:uncharacterized protein LOC126784556 n=1 Tax=Argentina anserina TaxID=57926 RepID=UPI0021762E93|nr:uncharacterized protein LOC126784556 [Potentilla anserina]
MMILLPCHQCMSLKEIDFEDEIDVLLSGCPRLEDLELNLCNVPRDLDISSVSLSELEISNCHAVDFEVNCKNLAIFVFRSECSCAHHDDEALFLWECGNLLFLYVTGVGLKQLHLLGCEQSMENHIYTPSLVYFFFSGVVEAKIHFKQLPPGLLDATVRITNLWWSFEYYSFLRDFLGSFDCCRELEIEIRDAEVLFNLVFNSPLV